MRRNHGRLVKRLRRRPLTPQTGVRFSYRSPFSSCNSIVGVDYGEGPPVPISNTVVKLTGADNTWLATAREDKLTPTQSGKRMLAAFAFSLYGISEVNLQKAALSGGFQRELQRIKLSFIPDGAAVKSSRSMKSFLNKRFYKLRSSR